MTTNSNVVKIVASESGALVRIYKSNPDFGFLVLQQESIDEIDGWYVESKRVGLQKGSTELLEKIVRSSFNQNENAYVLTGNLVVEEYLENSIPESISKRFLDKDLKFEESIQPYLKRAGKDGPALKSGEYRICRFIMLDKTGSKDDIKIKHDNHAEIAKYKDGGKAKSLKK